MLDASNGALTVELANLLEIHDEFDEEQVLQEIKDIVVI